MTKTVPPPPPRRPLGRTGILAPALGLGAGPLGAADVPEEDATRLVHTALDHGVTLIDTAPSYGASETRIGRALRGRRDEALLVTKGGYGVPGTVDWTPACVAGGIDRALERLQTDHLDVFLLHSCPLDVLARGDLLGPLVRARASGKVRAIGYSGDGETLAWAVRCSDLDVVECSVSLLDQEALAASVPAAARARLGVLAKRAVANAVWRIASRPDRADLAAYWERFQVLFPDRTPRGLTPEGARLAWDALALRFSAHAPGVATALVGTTSTAHLVAAAAHVADGPLPAGDVATLRARFEAHGTTWPGVV